MSYGPIELLVIKFPGSQFTGELTPALKDVVEGGIIRIIDSLLVHKDAERVRSGKGARTRNVSDVPVFAD